MDPQLGRNYILLALGDKKIHYLCLLVIVLLGGNLILMKLEMALDANFNPFKRTFLEYSCT